MNLGTPSCANQHFKFHAVEFCFKKMPLNLVHLTPTENFLAGICDICRWISSIILFIFEVFSDRRANYIGWKHPTSPYMCKRSCKLLTLGPLALKTKFLSDFFKHLWQFLDRQWHFCLSWHIFFQCSIKAAPVFCALVSFRMAWLNDEKLLMAYGGDPQEILCDFHW